MAISGMTAGIAVMTIEVSGITFSANFNGSTGYAAALVQARGALFLQQLNAQTQKMAIDQHGNPVTSLNHAQIVGAQNGADLVAQTAQADAVATIGYLQANAFALIPKGAVDGTNPVNALQLELF